MEVSHSLSHLLIIQRQHIIIEKCDVLAVCSGFYKSRLYRIGQTVLGALVYDMLLHRELHPIREKSFCGESGGQLDSSVEEMDSTITRFGADIKRFKTE